MIVPPMSARRAGGGEFVDKLGLTRRLKWKVGAVVAGVGVLASPLAAHAHGQHIDKWWENRLGDWASNDWTTQRQANQTLQFKTCSHNWSAGWGNNNNVTIQLVEVKDFLPDVVRGQWGYACNNTDKNFVSGLTNSTKFHFDFEPNVDARTNGTMTVHHSGK